MKMTPFARAGVTGKRPAKSGWSSFFGHFVRFLNTVFDLKFREVFECKYTVGGVLEHRFC